MDLGISANNPTAYNFVTHAVICLFLSVVTAITDNTTVKLSPFVEGMLEVNDQPYNSSGVVLHAMEAARINHSVGETGIKVNG